MMRECGMLLKENLRREASPLGEKGKGVTVLIVS